MNTNRLHQIFAHYIDRFEELNNPEHIEYYKWQIIKRFRNEMDKALASPSDKFSSELYRIKKLTANLIDNYTQSFHYSKMLKRPEPACRYLSRQNCI